ncbi:hypothetical protein ACS5PN_26610 [Roseateles sp. NT4]|uniref:hypothetical protein n=1 Tax=Roseateles sp. NT4 TaxID=3453715 RepID=UPI003EEB8158
MKIDSIDALSISFKNHAMRRSCISLALRIAQILALGQVLISTATASATYRYGFEIVRAQDADPPAVPESLQAALVAAEEVARAHPADLAPPWVDLPNGRVVVSGATSSGMKLAQAAMKELNRPINGGGPASLASSPSPGLLQAPPARRSLASLQAIEDSIIAADSLDDAEQVQMIRQDAASNRLVITVRSASDRLLKSLAEKFDGDSLLIEVDETDIEQTTGRFYDFSPFSGGAEVRALNGFNRPYWFCTTGFPWKVNITLYGTHVSGGMLTAGHCALPNEITYFWSTNSTTLTPGSNAAVGNQYMGKILPGWSTYRSDVGSVKMANSGTYQGDVALILVTPRGEDVTSYIYGVHSAGPGNVPMHKVQGMLHRPMKPGDQNVCYSGTQSGEMCGYNVTAIGISYKPRGEKWHRNLVVAQKGRKFLDNNACAKPGDSGSPVFALAGNKAVALGILSGKETGYFNCKIFFTDMHTVAGAFPGTLAIH